MEGEGFNLNKLFYFRGMYCDLRRAKFINHSTRINRDTINVFRSDIMLIFENRCKFPWLGNGDINKASRIFAHCA